MERVLEKEGTVGPEPLLRSHQAFLVLLQCGKVTGPEEFDERIRLLFLQAPRHTAVMDIYLLGVVIDDTPHHLLDQASDLLPG